MTGTDEGNREGVAGDHTTPVRQAWDGATWAEIAVDEGSVPEPPEVWLELLGTLGTVITRLRSRRR